MKFVLPLWVVLGGLIVATCGSVKPGGSDGGAGGGGAGTTGVAGQTTGGRGGSAGAGGGGAGTTGVAGQTTGGRGGSAGAAGGGGASGGGGACATVGSNCFNGQTCCAGLSCCPGTQAGQATCSAGVCVGDVGGRGGGGQAGGGGRGGGGQAGGGGRGGAGGGAGGAGGRRSCQNDGECEGFKCCGGFCANPGNDILNCGSCNNVCGGTRPFCSGAGTCATGWPCDLVGATCGAGTTCCGSQCCTGAQLCCLVTLGPTFLGCFDPVNGTCPIGCADCNCAAPTTPIATPAGDRAISLLVAGDLVYSIDRGSVAVVPIRRVHRAPVTGAHRMVELKLAHGATIRISPRHPTGDGRHFGALAVGDTVDGVRVIGASLVDYAEPFTYDILPESDSGMYFAGGVLIGSTLSSGSGGPVMSIDSPRSVRRASVRSITHIARP